MDHAVFRNDGEMQMNATNGWYVKIVVTLIHHSEMGTCDTAAVRDTFVTSPGKILKLNWNVLIDGVFSEEAKTKIATVTGELNYYYANTGFQFQSYLTYYNSPYVGYRIGMLTCTSTVNCVNAMTLMQHLRGTTWQKGGAFQVLTQVPETESINGAVCIDSIIT